jgi:cellulose biosynthesis protein BcsQ
MTFLRFLSSFCASTNCYKLSGWDKGDNLHILPANATLTDLEPELLRRVDGQWQLKHALQPLLDAFDVIVIDTPPTLGIWTQAPLVASTDLLIPVDVGSFSLEGCANCWTPSPVCVRRCL